MQLTRQQRAEGTCIAFNFRFCVNSIKAHTEAPVAVQAISTAQVQVDGLQVGLAAVNASRVAVVKFCCQTVVGGHRRTPTKLIVDWHNKVHVRNPGDWRDVVLVSTLPG
ncbi:hypothetical protein D3C76_1251620 [compost metagenome]